MAPGKTNGTIEGKKRVQGLSGSRSACGPLPTREAVRTPVGHGYSILDAAYRIDAHGSSSSTSASNSCSGSSSSNSDSSFGDDSRRSSSRGNSGGRSGGCLATAACLVLAGVACLPGGAEATHVIKVKNMCKRAMYIGLMGKPAPLAKAGGFGLPLNTTITLTVPDKWSGRLWGRTGCKPDASGGIQCETGACGSRMACDGLSGGTPATLAEITFDAGAQGNLDFYDISLVDGYNLPISMTPLAGTYVPPAAGATYDCARAGCSTDLIPTCPNELKFFGRDGKTVVGCRSACDVFNADQYCCRNAYGTPATCDPSSYSLKFKKACPRAYSYAYDDPSSTFTCRGQSEGRTGYVITFCA
ncbi:unnamed protein product [Phaeothamnion confervicola]